VHFAITCLDKADAGGTRAEHRPAHLDYLRANQGKILTAGPLLGDDGARPVGSLLILDFADRAEAEAFTKNDPYAKAGLFESVTIRPWRKVFPEA